MVKLKSNPVGIKELTNYLESESDFDFELRVLRSLRELEINCDHGGHYEDPVTKKSREFDIRLKFSEGSYHFFSAIECKNLKPNFPLLVSCVPRTPEEAWHFAAETRPAWTKSHTIKGRDSRYAPLGVVGKSTAQVGLTQSGELTANDSELYEKWGQCLASLYGMVKNISGLPVGSFYTAIPILVVPNETLWQVCYSWDGSRAEDPEQVDQCAVYAGGYEIPFDSSSRFGVSHVEIMTFRGLKTFSRRYLCSESAMRSLILGSHVLD